MINPLSDSAGLKIKVVLLSYDVSSSGELSEPEIPEIPANLL
jgi:hypothetical protein